MPLKKSVPFISGQMKLSVCSVCLLLKTDFDPYLPICFFNRVRKTISNPALLLMVPLAPSLMWPNLICTSSAP